jgi:hypothetical protein
MQLNRQRSVNSCRPVRCRLRHSPKRLQAMEPCHRPLAHSRTAQPRYAPAIRCPNAEERRGSPLPMSTELRASQALVLRVDLRLEEHSAHSERSDDRVERPLRLSAPLSPVELCWRPSRCTALGADESRLRTGPASGPAGGRVRRHPTDITRPHLVARRPGRVRSPSAPLEAQLLFV